MTFDPRPLPERTRWLLAGLLAVLYFVIGGLSLRLAAQPGNVSALWPPSGVALAAVLVFGRRLWPGIVVGSSAANLFYFPAAHVGVGSVIGSIVIAFGSALEVATASWIIERYAGGRDAIERPGRVVAFAVSVAASAVLAAAVGLASTSAFGELSRTHAVDFFFTWWIGDAVGMITVAPLALRLAIPDDPALRATRRVEWLVAIAFTLVAGQIVFGRPLPSPTGSPLPIAWLIVVPAMWAALRLGARGVSTVALLIYVLGSWGTISQRGPMGTHPVQLGLLVLDGLLVTVVVSGLLLASESARAARGRAELVAERALLEEKVRERTLKLAAANEALSTEMATRARLGAQLVEAQKQEALGRLAGGVAHDFNNLLTVITGEAGLALDSEAASVEIRDAARAILAASGRASELTKQLLAVARRQPTAPRAVDVGKALADGRRLLRPLIPADVTLDVMQGPAKAVVKIDPTQLDQIVMNLVINARDAMPKGGAVTVSYAIRDLAADAATERGLRAGRWVVLEVRDTGTGIAPEVLSRIFEPFFTTKESGRGTGLGLSTARGLAEQSGGTMTVSSVVGQGTTFQVWLPFAAAERERTPVPGGRAPSHVEVGDGQTILIAEDEPLVRRLVVATLERNGYSVIVAHDGEEALALARQPGRAIDLVLTDVVMPRKGGAELVRALRESSPVRVLFMSGYHEQHAELEGEAFIAKPFTVDALLRAVARALEGDPARAS